MFVTCFLPCNILDLKHPLKPETDDDLTPATNNDLC